jgi:hypothetical protein
MKKCSVAIASPLSLLFNESFNTGILPSQWKLATIVPVFKKGNKSYPRNYRPFNLTSPICRLMEKILSISIRDTFKPHFDEYQFGFLNQRSCVQSVLYSLSKWEQALKLKQNVDVIYFDFEKAFDKINHKLLVAKLNQLGLDRKIIQWLNSFLSNRRCVVKIGTKLSTTELPVHTSVPQGTVTGPLLFLLFINDIHQCLPPTVSYALFADDLKIFGSNVDDLQLAINNIHEWSKTWELPLSNSKINVLHLGVDNPRCEYRIGNINISPVSIIRDLGIYIDDKLNFESHINRKISIAYAKCSAILRAFTFKKPEQFFKLYEVYVRPIIDYGSEVYQPKERSKLSSLVEKPLRFFTRKVFQRFGISYESYQQRLEKFNIMSHRCSQIKSDLSLCYKLLFRISYFPHYPFVISSSARHNLRLVSQINCYNNHHFYLRRIIPMWNSIVPYIQHVDCLTKFKLFLKTFDVSNVPC